MDMQASLSKGASIRREKVEPHTNENFREGHHDHNKPGQCNDEDSAGFISLCPQKVPL